MHKTLELLQKLTEKFPPPEERSHALTLIPKPPGLRLMLHRGDTWLALDLDLTDLDLPVDDLVGQIEQLASTIPLP